MEQFNVFLKSEKIMQRKAESYAKRPKQVHYAKKKTMDIAQKRVMEMQQSYVKAQARLQSYNNFQKRRIVNIVKGNYGEKHHV